MTVRLELSPEVQAGLLSQAQANGLTLEAFAEQVLKEKSAASGTVRAGSSEERLRLFNDWVKSHADMRIVLPDDAMERESIYGDHGR